MKRYIFKFEHIKLNAEFLGLTYSHVLKSGCFQNNNYPASTNTIVLNHSFDFSNQFTKDIWFNIYNGKYEVLIEYPEFESDSNSPKLEINKTITITPNNEDEEDLAYEEQIIINRACRELYKTLPVEYLKTAGFHPGFNFYDEAYIWTDEQRASMWSSFIGELQITLISIE
jgi:hypothetical protein